MNKYSKRFQLLESHGAEIVRARFGDRLLEVMRDARARGDPSSLEAWRRLSRPSGKARNSRPFLSYYDMNDRKEDAARAAWLYFVRGHTQDEVALQLGTSRPTTQRLIAFAVSEKLVRFKVDHPLVACLALGAQVARRYGLVFCDVAPSDPKAIDAREVVAPCLAERLLRIVSVKRPIIVGIGSGRTLRLAVDQMERISRPQHRVVSLVGSTSDGGRAGQFDVVTRLADRIGADRYPLQVPVVAGSASDRVTLQARQAYRALLKLRNEADAVILGIGEVGAGAQIVEDGFLTMAEMECLVAQGAVGEITGWAFDAEGNVIDCPINARVTSMPLTASPERPTIIAGGGRSKIAPLRAALSGRLATALITDERTACSLLSDRSDHSPSPNLVAV